MGGPDDDLNAGGWRSGPKDSKNIEHLGYVMDRFRYTVLGVWGSLGALGGLDNKVMVQGVIYLSCTSNFIL